MVVQSNVFMKLEMNVLQSYNEEMERMVYDVIDFNYHGLQYMQHTESFIESDVNIQKESVRRHYIIYVMLDTQNAMRVQKYDEVIFDSKISIDYIQAAYKGIIQVILEMGIRAYVAPLQKIGVGINIPLSNVSVNSIAADVHLVYVKDGVQNTTDIIGISALDAVFNVLILDGVDGDFFDMICKHIGVARPDIAALPQDEDSSMSLSDILEEADDDMDMQKTDESK